MAIVRAMIKFDGLTLLTASQFQLEETLGKTPAGGIIEQRLGSYSAHGQIFSYC